jgi:hypothetical protein
VGSPAGFIQHPGRAVRPIMQVTSWVLKRLSMSLVEIAGKL